MTAASAGRFTIPTGSQESEHHSDPGRVSHACYSVGMAREISQRELRNDSGEVMRALDAGESFTVTRNGVAVGELTPIRHRRFVDRAAVLDAFAGAPEIDLERFRSDVDRIALQDALPRA